jgi:hypothetical protein
VKIIISIGIGLILSLPQIISIIIRGGRKSPSEGIMKDFGEYMNYDKDFWEDEECLNCGEEKEQ